MDAVPTPCAQMSPARPRAPGKSQTWPFSFPGKSPGSSTLISRIISSFKECLGGAGDPRRGGGIFKPNMSLSEPPWVRQDRSRPSGISREYPQSTLSTMSHLGQLSPLFPLWNFPFSFSLVPCLCPFPHPAFPWPFPQDLCLSRCVQVSWCCSQET